MAPVLGAVEGRIIIIKNAMLEVVFHMTPKDLVRGAIRLISLPEIFFKVNEMVDDPGCSASDIGNIISKDVALTARLLRIANSPLYNFPSRIATVSRSITVIGTKGVRDLILASSAIDAFAKVKSGFIDARAFWGHSLCCAVAARELAITGNALHAEPFFVAGLLHDIGQMIIHHKLPEMARECYLRSVDSGQSVATVEREVIGFDHGQVGGELLRYWQLPANLVDAVEFHHAPGLAENSPYTAAIVHIANAIANLEYPLVPAAYRHAGAQRGTTTISPDAWTITGLQEQCLAPVAKAVREQLQALVNLFIPKAA